MIRYDLTRKLGSRLITITVAALLFSLAMPTSLAASSISKAAPDFTLPGIQGQKSLDDYHGQYLYVDFWASWCGPCRQSFPWMNDMQSRYESHGLKILAINLDEKRDDAIRFLDEVTAEVDIAFDALGLTAQAFSVQGMPSSYLINPAGEIVYRHIGFRKRDMQELEAQIALLMGEI